MKTTYYSILFCSLFLLSFGCSKEKESNANQEDAGPNDTLDLTFSDPNDESDGNGDESDDVGAESDSDSDSDSDGDEAPDDDNTPTSNLNTGGDGDLDDSDVDDELSDDETGSTANSTSGTDDDDGCSYICIEWRDCLEQGGDYVPGDGCPAEEEICCNLENVQDDSENDGTGVDDTVDQDESETENPDNGTAESDTDTASEIESEVESDVTATDTAFDTDLNNHQLAEGVTIQKVALYQGVEIPLMTDGQTIRDRNAPVVQGRDGLLRVHVDTNAGWQNRQIRAVLELSSAAGNSIQETTMTVRSDSTQSNLQTTYNFDIPGELLNGDLTYRVSLLETSSQNGQGNGDGDTTGAVWPDETTTASFDEESHEGDVEIVIVPIQYNADGSGRMPDVSDAQIERYRDYFQRFYPMSNNGLRITVGDTLPVNVPVRPLNDADWENLIVEVVYERFYDSASPKQYYFGVVQPSESIEDFCSWGCVMGMGFVQPYPGYYDGLTAVAVGLGYPGDMAARTMIHEIGHNHGREHAPCDVDLADENYPYSGGSIGVWGYDPAAEALMSPNTYTDFMGYCMDLWVSDYTYGHLFDWIRSTNSLNVKSMSSIQKVSWLSIIIDGQGELTLGPPVQSERPRRGLEKEVTLMDANKQPVGTSTGYFVPIDHSPSAGIIFIQEPEDSIHFVTVENASPIAI